MKKGRKIALSIALIIWALLLGATFYYLYGIYSSINEDIPTISAFEHQQIEANGNPIVMKTGDVISIDFDESAYSFKMFEKEETAAEFVVNNFLFFKTEVGKEKKIDLNGDNVYDVIIHVNEIRPEDISVSFEMTNEKQSIGGDVTEKLDRFERNSQLQTNVMIFVMLLTLLVLIYLMIKAFIIPKVEEKRKLSRKSETETFEELYGKFNEYKKSNEKKAKTIYDRAEHMYNYMSEEDKKEVNSEFESMKKYIK